MCCKIVKSCFNGFNYVSGTSSEICIALHCISQRCDTLLLCMHVQLTQLTTRYDTSAHCYRLDRGQNSVHLGQLACCITPVPSVQPSHTLATVQLV
jgi:hypothetical protein